MCTGGILVVLYICTLDPLRRGTVMHLGKGASLKMLVFYPQRAIILLYQVRLGALFFFLSLLACWGCLYFPFNPYHP